MTPDQPKRRAKVKFEIPDGRGPLFDWADVSAGAKIGDAAIVSWRNSFCGGGRRIETRVEHCPGVIVGFSQESSDEAGQGVVLPGGD